MNTIDKDVIELEIKTEALEMNNEEIVDAISTHVELLELDMKKLVLQLTKSTSRFAAIETMNQIDNDMLRLGSWFSSYRKKNSDLAPRDLTKLPSTLGDVEEHDPDNFEFQPAS